MKTIKARIPEVISYFFILLFCYASISKILDFENFQIQIGQSPLLSAYAGIVSYSVITVELLIVIFLATPIYRFLGLYASFGIMVSFTIYIYIILNYSDFVPCSCGGILEKMGWTEHLIFNIVCIVLAGVAIISDRLNNQKVKNLNQDQKFEKQQSISGKKLVLREIGIMIVLGIVSSVMIIFLFFTSEHIIKKENNFTRRFPHHAVIEDKTYKLDVNSYYFAGYDQEKIYLGNYTAPLVITEIDSAFSKIKQYTIKLDNDKYDFKSIKINIMPPYIFVADGTVPVIYRAKISDKKAETISYRNVFFNSFQPIDSASFVFRSANTAKQTQFIGKISTANDFSIKFNYKIINAQHNGLFDTDGKLIMLNNGRRFIYNYYYRNEYMVFDNDLENLSTFKTIDTISKANIEISHTKNGTLKMAKPPLIVNGDITAYNTVLFVKSNLMGKYESKKMWQNSSIIDMYNIQDGAYFGSFYVRNRGKDKISQILATDKYFYAICGNQMIRYGYAQSVLDQLGQGRSRNP